MKKLCALCVLCITACILTGCNTVSGFGKDVQKVGQAVQGAGGK